MKIYCYLLNRIMLVANIIKKIRNFFNFFKINKILLFIKKFPLRFKYKETLKINNFIPTRHIVAIDVLQKLSKIYEPLGIKFFLTGGLLLGAVRQKAFAGRPSDLDIGIIDVDLDKFMKNISLIENKFEIWPIRNHKGIPDKKTNFLGTEFHLLQKHTDHWYSNKQIKFYKFEGHRIFFFLDGLLLDIEIYVKKKINKNIYWYSSFLKGEKRLGTDRIVDIYFNYENLINLKKIKCYGLNFFSPQNPESYLKKIFGNDWKIKDTKYKQIIWND